MTKYLFFALLLAAVMLLVATPAFAEEAEAGNSEVAAGAANTEETGGAANTEETAGAANTEATGGAANTEETAGAGAANTEAASGAANTEETAGGANTEATAGAGTGNTEEAVTPAAADGTGAAAAPAASNAANAAEAAAPAADTKTGPFATRNSDATAELAALIADLDTITNSVVANPYTPQPVSNTPEEIALRQLTQKVSAREATSTPDEDTKRVADPYEISILHKLSEKIRGIQSVAVSNAFPSVSVPDVSSAVVSQLIDMIRGIRETVAARETQKKHVQYSDKQLDRLERMQRLVKKMNRLENDGSLSQDQYQQRFNKLHRKLEKLQGRKY